MTFSLVVVRAFGAYALGDPISDPAAIRAVMGGEHAGYVVRVTHSDSQGS